jgi:predicted ester cyclase
VNQRNKAFVWDIWQQMNRVGSDKVAGILQASLHKDIVWNGPHPTDTLRGTDALIADFWQPLLQSFPDLVRRTDILMGGQFGGKDWVTATGYFTGTFAADWLGIPATGKETHIRFGEFSAIENGKITETKMILDILDVMRQAGINPLPPDRGATGLVPGPTSGDGVMLHMQPAEKGAYSLDLVTTMGKALGADFDGVDLNSMRLERYWHPERMSWYGSVGIGTARTLRGFQQVMQGPWKRAFPDSATRQKWRIWLGEGDYAAYAGRTIVTHLGEYLGCPATGKTVDILVMDWWWRDGDLLVENWNMIDLIDLFHQLDVDLLQDLRTDTIED